MATSINNGVSREKTLELNEVETKLRNLLLDVARYINPGKPSQLRFTGGWVRDKLLGVLSHDIDVAINDMTGYQFALKMKDYLDDPEHGRSNPASEPDVFGTIAKIEANPEKSKHLETVTTKIFGLDIDFVNLRKETYSEDSRNPAMEFGTPEEDALRRDATINALFYNLQTEKIEDFTARGLDDMRSHIVRTPLEPYQTFRDDPLRVLRLIRFASRLQYSIDPATKHAMQEQGIKDALKVKISRERVGVELDKMLKGPDPHLSLSLINEMNLYSTIFSDPLMDHPFVPDTSHWNTYFDCVGNLFNHPDSPIVQILNISDSEQYHAWLLSAFIPYADAPPVEAKPGKLGSPIATVVAREGIRASNKICDIITLTMQHFEQIITAKDKFVRRNQGTPGDIDPGARDILGMAIRRWGASWRNQALFAMLVDYGRSNRDVISEWKQFLEHLRSLHLLDAVNIKPVINGTALAKALNTKPGPWMKEALDVVMAWQLRNPNTATEENAIDAVRKHQQQQSQASKDQSRSAELFQSQGELVADLVNAFLLLTIRPLFAKTTQAHADVITPQGRKVERAMTTEGPNPRRYDENEDENITKPWKDRKHVHSLDLLEWVVQNLTPSLAEKHWPLLIPPILTLLDDMDTSFKVRGCDLLRLLLKATPPPLLKRTGLGEVFEQALSPSLSYLPSLTPEPDAIHILDSAYPALFTLVSAKSALLPATSERATQEAKALTEILHANILPSFSHIAPSPATIMLPYPLLTATLTAHLRTLISRLKLNTIPQLQYLVPLLSGLMTTPFATASLETLHVLKATTYAMQSVIACSWVRVERWRAEILYPCCETWLALLKEEEDSNAGSTAQRNGKETKKLELLVEIKASLQVCVSMLVRAVETTSASAQDESERSRPSDTESTSPDVRSEIAQLLHANEKLSELFKEFNSGN